MTEQNSAAAGVEMDVPVLTPSVSEQLRAAREKTGRSVSDVAQALKLGVRQVEALERGDWSALPGPTFIRGFVRNYARTIGVDSTSFMAQLDQVMDKPAVVLSVPESATHSVAYNHSGAREDRRMILLGLCAAMLAGAVYFLLPDDLADLRQQTQAVIDSLSRQEEAPPPAAVLPASNEPVFPPGTTPQQVMNPQSVAPLEQLAPAAVASNAVEATADKPLDGALSTRLNIEIVRESWIEIKDRDNQVIFSQQLASGVQREVVGNGPLTLHIGFAPGVKLKWRGQDVDLVPHTRGQTARLVLE